MKGSEHTLYISRTLGARDCTSHQVDASLTVTDRAGQSLVCFVDVDCEQDLMEV